MDSSKQGCVPCFIALALVVLGVVFVSSPVSALILLFFIPNIIKAIGRSITIETTLNPDMHTWGEEKSTSDSEKSIPEVTVLESFISQISDPTKDSNVDEKVSADNKTASESAYTPMTSDAYSFSSPVKESVTAPFQCPSCNFGTGTKMEVCPKCGKPW